MVKVIMMGPPGGGKGTQSIRLSNHLKIPHISSGDMMRDIVKSIEQIDDKERTAMQKELLKCMETGNLVSNEVICDLVMNKLSSMDSFVLDGFPRNLEQAQLIHELAEIVIYINTELDECVRRIVIRGEGRPDDKQEIAEERMRVYCKETVPAIEYFRDHQNFYEINGNINKETTTEQIFKIFDSEIKK